MPVNVPINTAAGHPDIIEILKLCNENPSIFFTVTADHEEAFRQWLDEGNNIGIVRQLDGASLLHIAVEYNRIDIARQLLDACHALRFNLLNKNDDNRTAPLHIASSVGHLDLVKLLLDYGADIDIAGDGKTPLILAAQNNHIDVVRLLLGYGVEVDKIDQTGRTALHIAALEGHTKTARLLVRLAILDQTDKNGFTPLHIAAGKGHTEIVLLLLDREAEIDKTAERWLYSPASCCPRRPDRNGHVVTGPGGRDR